MATYCLEDRFEPCAHLAVASSAGLSGDREWPLRTVNCSLAIEHIEDWAKLKEHEFENMIVLCWDCHGVKGEKPCEFSRVALRQYKANLGLLNYRYGELERRLLEDFGQETNSKY